jgi:hypothetical protein
MWGVEEEGKGRENGRAVGIPPIVEETEGCSCSKARRMTDMEAVLVREVRVKERVKFPEQWRKKFLPKARMVLDRWIESLEGQSRIPVVEGKGKVRKERGQV